MIEVAVDQAFMASEKYRLGWDEMSVLSMFNRFVMASPERLEEFKTFVNLQAEEEARMSDEESPFRDELPDWEDDGPGPYPENDLLPDQNPLGDDTPDRDGPGF